MSSSSHQDEELCKILVENVEDKSPTDIDGWTPLHYAANKGHEGICKYLVKIMDDKRFD